MTGLLQKKLYKNSEKSIYNTYFMLNKPLWLDPMNAKYRYEAEKGFQRYYKKHKECLHNIFLREIKSRIRSVYAV